MSTWDPESEISKFNRWESLEPYDVSQQFYRSSGKCVVSIEENQWYV